MNTIIQNILSLHASDRPVAYLQDACYSYADFYQDINCMTKKIQQHPADTWALWIEDGYAFAVNFFALMLAGKEIILPPNRLEQTQTWLEKQQVAFWDTHPNQLTESYEDQNYKWHQADWENAKVVFFTSGSTGTPKRITHTFGQVMAELEVLRSFLPLSAEHTVLATVSHQHMYGLYYKILLPIQQGAAFICEQCLYPEDLSFRQQHVKTPHSVLISSPAFLSRWQQAQEANAYSYIVSAGGPLPKDVPEQLQHDIIEIFGSSESGGMAWRHALSTWQIFPQVNIRVDDGSELWIQSPYAYTNEWIRTGDKVHLDSSGQTFELIGRTDRVVKLEEKRLSLNAIESTLASHPWIAEAHVLVLSQAQKQVLATVCTLTTDGWKQLRQQGKTAFVQTLKTTLNGQLERIALPKRWRFEHFLPRNSQSKLDHTAIQNLFTQQIRPFARVLKQQEHSAEILLWFPPELRCFQGHFPGMPIYPGVAQIDFVQHHARQLWWQNAHCMKIEQLKFQKTICAYDQVLLTLERQDNKVHFKLKLNENHEPVATGRLYFQTNEAV